jgi:cell division septum initiation protein DivIVA
MTDLTAKEALQAEFLADINKAIDRLEAIDGQLKTNIEKAVNEASGRAFLAARMQQETALNDSLSNILAEAKKSAKEIEGQLSKPAHRYVAGAQALEKGLVRLFWFAIAGSATAGAVAGLVVALVVK